MAQSKQDFIIDLVCKLCRIERKILVSKLRRREVTDARFIAINLLRVHTNLSHKSIGLLFNRDHSTSVHAVNEHQHLMDNIGGQYDEYVKTYNEANNIVSLKYPTVIYHIKEAGVERDANEGPFHMMDMPFYIKHTT